MIFIGLKDASIVGNEVLDKNFNFDWSEKYYHPLVVNFQR